MVHTAVAEKKDLRRVIDCYLMAYRAAPHKTTGLSPYEMMFGRKMRNNLPQNLTKKKGSEREEEARARRDKKKSEQKEGFDRKQKSKEKKLNKGDEVLVQQKKTSVRPPWDPEGYKVKEVKGSKVTLQRGGKTKIRAKNNLKDKVLPKRPQELSNIVGFRPRRRDDAMQDLGSNAGSRTKSRTTPSWTSGATPASRPREGATTSWTWRWTGRPYRPWETRPTLQDHGQKKKAKKKRGHDRRKRAKKKRDAKTKGLPPRRRDAKKKGLRRGQAIATGASRVRGGRRGRGSPRRRTRTRHRARGHPADGHPAPGGLLAGAGERGKEEEATIEVGSGAREGLLGGEAAQGAEHGGARLKAAHPAAQPTGQPAGRPPDPV